MPDGIPMSPSIAERYGVCAALLLAQIHYWCRVAGHHIHGEKWVYKTHGQWSEELRGLYKVTSIRAALHTLEREQLIIVGSFNRLPQDNTKWYRVNHEVLSHIFKTKEGAVQKLGGTPSKKCTTPLQILEDPPPKTDLALPENTQENTQEINTTATPLSEKDLNMKITKNGGKPTPPKKVSTSDAILAELQKKNHNLPDVEPNSKASARAIWNTIPKFNDTVKIVPALTLKDLSYLNYCVGQWGPTSDKYLTFVIQHWVAFTNFVADQHGLPKKSMPAAPYLPFLKKRCGDVPNFVEKEVQQELQAIALPGKSNPNKAKTPVKTSATLAPPKITPKAPELVSDDKKPATQEEIDAINKELGLDF